MNYYLVAPNSLVRADETAFTYHSENQLAIGSIVRVSAGRRTVNGVVIKAVPKPSFKTKAVLDQVAPNPLPPALLKTAFWLSEYYATHLGTVLQTLLPAGLHKQRRDSKKDEVHPQRNRTKIVLNPSQKAALQAIEAQKNQTILLHGVTGSGKTQVYIEAAKQQALQGQSSIILVPEIALTPQLVAEFSHHFTHLIVTHSGLTEAQRHKAWQYVLDHQNEPLIIIGPRSALFMPVANLGLLVVDECHEPSYKQEQSPRYSALRAARILVEAHSNARLILGSATPGVQEYYLAKKTESPIITLSETARQSTPPVIEVVDFKLRRHFPRHRFLSQALVSCIEQALTENRQALLFHNRRGTAPHTICDHCGWLAECPTCFLPLTLHADQHALRCHLCRFTTGVPPSCPVCHEPTVTFKGIGTKLIETEVSKLFPKASIARFDADTHDTEALHKRYQELYDGTINIMIGTQMLAKGLDLPHLGMVGVIQADSGLMLPDYQAEERVFQLLYQVIGRAGRNAHTSSVVIQTFQPDHPAITSAVARDYHSFYTFEIARRAKQHFPPFCYLLKLTCSYKTEAGAINASQKLAAQLRDSHAHIEVLGPTPSFHERLGGNYRWQIVVKSPTRRLLISLAKEIPAGWQTDLDPASLL